VIIVKRKSDGMIHRGPGRSRRSKWSFDISKCKPFANVAAVKTSLYGYAFNEIAKKARKISGMESCRCEDWRNRNCAWCKAARNVKESVLRRDFEFLPAKITVSI